MKLGLDASFLSFSHFFCSFVVLFQFNALTWSLLNNFQGNALVLTIVILRELFSRFVHLPICALLSSACRCPPGTLSHPTHINTIKISQFHPALVFLKPERTMLQSNPPLLQHYGALVRQPTEFPALVCNEPKNRVVMEECQLPLIDLNDLNRDNEREKLACCEAICRASLEWGFFQVVNHGISPELLRRMRREQVKLFQTPFEKKTTCGLLNNSYRWGTPTATSPKQFSWSEAFHIPLSQISEEACYGEYNSLREVMKEFAAAMLKLARLLAGILAENLGNQKTVFEDICEESTCFLRLNRYPACPISPEIFGLVPHTDSDFLTILCQDEVGGLQLMKDSQWVSAKPIKDALVVNIGDLFQAWSNNVYKSVEHKVMANRTTERYSMAYFLCPSYDSLIASCGEPSIYRKFTFGEYRSQVREDVQKTGYKVGLPRFLL